MIKRTDDEIMKRVMTGKTETTIIKRNRDKTRIEVKYVQKGTRFINIRKLYTDSDEFVVYDLRGLVEHNGKLQELRHGREVWFALNEVIPCCMWVYPKENVQINIGIGYHGGLKCKDQRIIDWLRRYEDRLRYEVGLVDLPRDRDMLCRIRARLWSKIKSLDHESITRCKQWPPST